MSKFLNVQISKGQAVTSGRRLGMSTAAIAAMPKTRAAKSCQCGHSPTINVAVSVPTKGTAMMLMALVVGGKLRAIPNQIICA